MAIFRQYLPLSAITCLLLVFGGAAQAEQSTAHEVVRQTTEAVMSAVQEARAREDGPGEAYYKEVQSLLDPVVDFRGFARGVMGPYATSARYRSLDEAGRERLVGQLDRFSEVMREGLVRTYSKGLLAFGGSRIEVPAPDSDQQGARETVQQLIYKDGAEPYVVLYQMGRNRDGEWKLRNMIIESVNLGEIYRSQFESSARQYDGDLDQVIANWSAVELDEA